VRRLRRHVDELRPDEPVRLDEKQADEQAEERGLAGKALRLQGLVGTTAVTALISRAGLQRENASTKQLPAKDEKARHTTYVMRMSNRLGSFELLSLQLSGTQNLGTATGSGAREQGAPAPKEFTVTIQNQERSWKLYECVRNATKIDSVDFVFIEDGKPFMTIKTTGVHLDGVSAAGGGTETYSLQSESTEYEYTPHGGR